MLNMKCEKCDSLYELTEDEFEERAEHKAPDLCPVCLDDLIEEQTEKPVKRCFEYIINNAYELNQLSELGQEGWEAISMMGNSNLLFKREYFKEA